MGPAASRTTLEVIEQITYLLFVRRMDDIQTLAERKARVTGGEIEDPVFLPGQHELRWSQLKNADPEVMFRIMAKRCSPSYARPAATTRP